MYAETIKIYLGEVTKKESFFTAIFEKADHWYIGHVEELPGANAQGKTLEEVRENLHEPIELILLSNRGVSRESGVVQGFYS